MIHFNLGSHDGRTIEELTSLVEATERAAFTTSSAAASTRDIETDCASPQLHQTQAYGSQATVSSQSDPQKFIPKTLSPEELKQAEDAFYFDLRSDFDEMYGREELEEETHG